MALEDDVKYLRDHPKALNSLPLYYRQAAKQLIEELIDGKKQEGGGAPPSSGSSTRKGKPARCA